MYLKAKAHAPEARTPEAPKLRGPTRKLYIRYHGIVYQSNVLRYNLQEKP